MTFRNDIQILRAIAVIFVVLYHLEVPGFANGLLGVDIFFAISGYLMFRIYNYDQGAGGFYARRGRRLLPGYFGTIICTLAAAFLMLQPSDFAQTAEQVFYAGFFASNIGFWSQNSYFSTVDFKPLLHLWSLAVELQFYLFVPLIMLFDRWNKYILPALVLASLMLCIILLYISPNLSFFMMPTRLWQFGLGMLAARACINGAGNPRIGLMAIVALLAMLFLPTIGQDAGLVQGHPGLGAILATAATALCLYHGLRDQWLDNVIVHALRRVGDYSYSIYLVHFPIIVLVNYQPFGGTILGSSTAASLAVMLALIGAMGWLCHQLFERRAGRWVTRPASLVACTALIAAGLWLPSFQSHHFDPLEQRISSAFTDRAPYRCGSMFRLQHFGDEFCAFGKPQAKRGNILLVGDSHSDAIKTAFVTEAKRAGYAVIFPVSNDAFVASHLDEEWLVQSARRYHAQQVFLHFSTANLKPAMIAKVQQQLWRHGIATTVIMPVPTREAIIPQILLDAHHHGVPPALKTRSQYEQDIGKVAAPLRMARPGYAVIEPSAILCQADCSIHDTNGRPLYFDKHHLTLTGARQLAPLFQAAMNPIKPVLAESALQP